MMYEATEGPLLGPLATVSVCVSIVVALDSLGTDVSVNILTPLTGPSVIGK